MSRESVFAWILLGLAVVVLLLITAYVDSWRREQRSRGQDR